MCLKMWRRHRCLNELKVTRHYWVLSKTKLFYGWIILLFFILFKKKKVETFYVCVIYITEYWISAINQSWHIPSSVRIFLKKLNSAYKWINCCNKSINMGVFTAGIVCIIYFNFYGLFSFTLHGFISMTVSCHVITPSQIWNLNELLN